MDSQRRKGTEMDQQHSHTTVYGRPGCVQCQYTTRLLDKEGIPYQYVDVDQNPTAATELKAVVESHKLSASLPLVTHQGSSPWTGFSPDKIRGIKRA